VAPARMQHCMVCMGGRCFIGGGMDDYRSTNSASMEQLNALLDRLGAAELAHRLPNGWTVADALVHLAFWDSYCLSLLQAWQAGAAPESYASFDGPRAADSINASVDALSRSIPPEAAVALLRSAALAIDQAVEALDPQLAATIFASKHNYLLFRSKHRNAHLLAIEKELCTCFE